MFLEFYTGFLDLLVIVPLKIGLQMCSRFDTIPCRGIPKNGLSLSLSCKCDLHCQSPLPLQLLTVCVDAPTIV